MRTYEDNYTKAFKALTYVNSRMQIGAPNNLGMKAAKQYLMMDGPPMPVVNQIQGAMTTIQGQIAKLILNNQRKKDDAYYQKLVNSKMYTSDAVKEMWLAEMAHSSNESWVGNCAEQAALAFIYLRDRNLFPIDYVYWGDMVGNIGGHTFAILDRHKNSVIEDPLTWGSNCAICDPHKENLVFPASMVQHYFGEKSFKLYLRLEAPTSVTQKVDSIGPYATVGGIDILL
jgi:hypothetical protein